MAALAYSVVAWLLASTIACLALASERTDRGKHYPIRFFLKCIYSAHLFPHESAQVMVALASKAVA